MTKKNKRSLQGRYTHYTFCRFCQKKALTQVVDLGNMPLAGGFLQKKDVPNEKLYPLTLSFCKNCFLLQSVNVIDKDTLFKEYFYHSSAIQTLQKHFLDIASEIKKSIQKKENPFVLEIGCNDGGLVEDLFKKKINVLGVDPATNIVTPKIKKGVPILNDYFSEKVAKKILKTHGKATVICSFNVMAHIEDMHDIAKGITLLLSDTGVFFFETHYVGSLLAEVQYDMIYHEHQYYYSLLTLQKFFTIYAMEIFDVMPVSIHGGSMRYYVQHIQTGSHKITKRVKNLEKEELSKHYDSLKTYTSFANEIKKTKKDLLLLLKQYKKEKQHIVGYGASGRGTIVMNYCGLDTSYLEYVIDDAPAKQGFFTPGTHLEIKSSDVLYKTSPPAFVLLFAWSFAKEIVKKHTKYLKNGGKFILPLPQVKTISS